MTGHAIFISLPARQLTSLCRNTALQHRLSASAARHSNCKSAKVTRAQSDRRLVSLPGNPWAPARWFALAGFMKIVAIAQASSYAAPFFVKGGMVGHTSLLVTVPFAIGLVLAGKWLIDSKLYARRLVLITTTALCLAAIAVLSSLSKSGPMQRRGSTPMASYASETNQERSDMAAGAQQQPSGRRPLSTLQPRPFSGQDPGALPNARRKD